MLVRVVRSLLLHLWRAAVSLAGLYSQLGMQVRKAYSVLPGKVTGARCPAGRHTSAVPVLANDVMKPAAADPRR